MAGTLSPAPHSSGAFRVGSGAAVISIISVMPMFLTAGLAVQISSDLQLAPAALGFVPASFFGAMVLSSPWAGRIITAVGATRAIRSAAVLVAVVLLLVATVASTLWILLVLLVVAGCANALAQPATNQIVASHIPWGRQGSAYGVKYSAIPVASMLAGVAVPTLGLTVGWRWAFVLFATVAVLGAGWPFGHLANTSTAPPGHLTAAVHPLRRRLLLVLAVGVGFAAAGGSTLAIFMVSSAVATGWDEGAAGILLALASVIGIVARLGSGALADRRGGNHLRFIAIMLVAGSVGVAGMAVGSGPVFAVAAPLAFAAGWGWPGVFILTVVRLNPATPAAATGFTQVGTSAGCVVGPLLFGLLADTTSYGIAWAVNSLLLAIAAAILALGRYLILRDRLLHDDHRTPATTDDLSPRDTKGSP